MIFCLSPEASWRVIYGNKNEETAQKAVSDKFSDEKIIECGLFIDEQYPYLGALPDRLIDSDGIREKKCTSSAAGKTWEVAKLEKLTTNTD